MHWTLEPVLCFWGGSGCGRSDLYKQGLGSQKKTPSLAQSVTHPTLTHVHVHVHVPPPGLHIRQERQRERRRAWGREEHHPHGHGHSHGPGHGATASGATSPDAIIEVAPSTRAK